MERKPTAANPSHFPPTPGPSQMAAFYPNQPPNKLMNLNDFIITVFAFAVVSLIPWAMWQKFSVVIVVPMHHLCIHSRHGKLIGLLDPGRHRFLGLGHEFEIHDKRLQQLTLQTQELTTLEGITVKITAVGLYRITDPLAATSATADFNSTLYTLIQLALRDTINGMEAETLMSNVRSLGPKLLELVQAKASNLGLQLTELVVRDVIVPTDIKSALSESWRSKKSALAELEVARGKAAAARTLANAAKLYSDHPALLKIRYIEAIEQASKGMGHTFVIGMSEDQALKHT